MYGDQFLVLLECVLRILYYAVICMALDLKSTGH